MCSIQPHEPGRATAGLYISHPAIVTATAVNGALPPYTELHASVPGLHRTFPAARPGRLYAAKRLEQRWKCDLTGLQALGEDLFSKMSDAAKKRQTIGVPVKGRGIARWPRHRYSLTYRSAQEGCDWTLEAYFERDKMLSWE